jgi:hypothetical protein
MNFSSLWQTWLKASTSPSDATFADLRQKPDANITTAMIWMLIYGVIAAVAGLVSSLIFAGTVQGALPSVLQQLDLPPAEMAQVEQALRFLPGNVAVGAGFSSLANIIWVPVWFLIGVGIYHLLARLLGGTGEYGRLAYLSAAFSAPLGIVTTLLSLIPLAGCVTPLIGIYTLVLSYFAVKVEHQLSSGRAIMVILIPALVLIVLAMCFIFGIVGMIMAVQSS